MQVQPLSALERKQKTSKLVYTSQQMGKIKISNLNAETSSVWITLALKYFKSPVR